LKEEWDKTKDNFHHREIAVLNPFQKYHSMATLGKTENKFSTRIQGIQESESNRDKEEEGKSRQRVQDKEFRPSTKPVKIQQPPTPKTGLRPRNNRKDQKRLQENRSRDLGARAYHDITKVKRRSVIKGRMKKIGKIADQMKTAKQITPTT